MKIQHLERSIVFSLYCLGIIQKLMSSVDLNGTMRIEQKLLLVEEQNAAGFYGKKGWGNEPITGEKGLNIGGELCGVFPDAVASMCLTAFFDADAIAQCNANLWFQYLEEMLVNLKNCETNQHKGFQLFRSLLLAVVNVELVELKKFLTNEKGIDIIKIAHRCGLMVLEKYNGKGIATALVIESDKLLISQGFQAVVVKTTHSGSQRVFEKNGYQKFKSFDWQLFNIPGDDKYSIMYKIF